MPKRKVFSIETAAKLEENRRRAVFENPPDPSEEKEVNMANAIKWHSWGWSKVDCYSKAGVAKKTFGRSVIKVHLILLQYAIDEIHFVTMLFKGTSRCCEWWYWALKDGP